MILATRQGNYTLRTAAQFGNSDRIPLPGEMGGIFSSSGTMVTQDAAMALPAVMAAIRLIAETLASLPLIVYSGDMLDKQPQPEAWQWPLLRDRPNDQQTAAEVWQYVSACIEGWGGSCLLKSKHLLTKQVMELFPQDPARCIPKIENGELVFKMRDGGGTQQTLSKADILYIPGLLTRNPLIGVSPISAHRDALGNAIALEAFGSRFFASDATPGLVIKSDPSTGNTKAQRDEAKEAWNARHSGAGNAHGTAVLPPGWTVERIGVSPADAQYLDGQKWNVDQAARAFKIHPPALIGGSDLNPRATPEQRNQDFLQYSLTHRLIRVEQRLHADDDLFPDKNLRPMFLADGLLRASIDLRYAAYTQARQAGWLSINDIRRKEGEPPIGPEGDDYQATPVGGAPNLQPQGPGGASVEPAEPAES